MTRQQNLDNGARNVGRRAFLKMMAAGAAASALAACAAGAPAEQAAAPAAPTAVPTPEPVTGGAGMMRPEGTPHAAARCEQPSV